MIAGYLKSRVSLIVLLGACCGVFAVVFNGFSIENTALRYAGALCLFMVAGHIFIDFILFAGKVRRLRKCAENIAVTAGELPETSSAAEKIYGEMIRGLFSQKECADSENAVKFAELSDYYTLWTHQIKVPIAAARLILQSGEIDAGEMSEQLCRIEGYTEMAMSYARLQSESDDFLFGEYSVDEMVHGAVKGLSPLFLRKGLSLNVKKSGKTVVTDKKHLEFVIGQIVSNAVKYTNEGGVEIYFDGDNLCVRDTGIGIAAEDIPRIFEKGYTGLNGRIDERSSGIGLYLCRKICDKLGHKLSAESSRNNGTVVKIDLKCDNTYFE